MQKRKNSIGWYSAYYRGLEALLEMWPKIREQVPDATLDCYYGWQSWVAVEGEDEFYHRMERKFEQLKDQGVTVHGRVSHEELAKAMLKTQVWAYPTQFLEIHCITALKANLAGMKVVCTDVGALKETAGPNATFIETDNVYSDDYAKEEFVDELVKALKNPLSQKEIKKQQDWAKFFSWDKIAAQWAEAVK